MELDETDDVDEESTKETSSGRRSSSPGQVAFVQIVTAFKINVRSF